MASDLWQSNGPNLTEIVVRGSLGPALKSALGAYEVISKDAGFTSITAKIVDQSQLLGLIAFCADLNIPIVSINPVDPARAGALTS
ncbi:hypothetical protein LG299_12645 [Microbacterium lacus]|uniref:hypothetical protein n=1 Tax=Microbacterium lacus TaxID=415217 RepID=UPI00384B5058